MKRLIILTFFSYSIGVAFSQPTKEVLYNNIINYKLSFKQKNSQKNYKEDYFVLFTNNSSSLYRSIGLAIYDTIQLTKQYNQLPQDQQIGIGMKYYADVDDIIITDLKSNTVEYTVYAPSVATVSPQYTETVLPKWKLINETKKINGIDCKKATRSLFGRNWIAWYSPTHAIPFGPYKFFGLPGLIVKVEDQTKSYIFELTLIKKRNHYHPTTVHEKVKNVSKADAIKIYEKSKYSMGLFADVKMDPAILKKIENQKKADKAENDNPIELKPFDYN